MKDLFNPKDWTCSVCHRVRAPILSINGVLFCTDHDPISRDERRKMQGMSDEIIKELNTPRK